MKAAWKGFANDNGCVMVEDERIEFTRYTRPVLVIDASKFPADYPEIGSEWVLKDGRLAPYNVKVVTAPVKEVDGLWYVGVENFMARKLPYWARIRDLKPLPQEATGEVVGTLTIDAHGWQTRPSLDEGEYDIIKRGDR
jgi:hypothetical protein